MKRVNRYFAKTVFALFLLFSPVAIPESSAFEPSSLITAAPHAAQLAKLWSPQVMRALGSTGTGLYKMGAATLNILRLPLGLLQCTAGAPFGFFGNGVQNIGAGVVAPFKMTWDILMLPLAMFGVSGG